MSCPKRSRSRWPPPPSVEDEVESLSRELDGLSALGKRLGIDGVIFRGVIDQYPVLVSVDPTPDFTIQNGYRRRPAPSYHHNRNAPTTSSVESSEELRYNPVSFSAQPATLRHGHSVLSSQYPPLAESISSSDSEARLESSHILSQTPLPKAPAASSRSSTLAERLEEKLRRRRALRHLNANMRPGAQESLPAAAEMSVSKPDTLMDCQLRTVVPPGITTGTTHSISAPESPTGPHSLPTNNAIFQNTDRAASVSSTPRTLTNSPQSPAQSLTKRAVACSDQAINELIPPSQAELDKSQPFQTSNTPQKPTHSDSTSGLCLMPCPRSIPTAGCHDWYTINGLTHLDICPSCMKQIGESKFREYFIPSLPKPLGQKVHCSFGEPWTRLAWVQTIKQQHYHLSMLYQITLPPPEIPPCSGRITSVQHWYRVIDPDTDTYLPNFDICAACTRNIHILMPQHRNTFTQSPIPQPRICDFATNSPRFTQYIDLLDSSPQEPNADITRFLTYARRKIALHDCPRNHAIPSTTWHYIRDLPELTVCEDCYDDVIWPLVKSGKPLARLFTSSPRLLPIGDRLRGASCQLYSPRMRAKVRDALCRIDLAYLRALSLRRYHAERSFRARMRELAEGGRWDWDWEEEVRAVEEEWSARE